MPFEILGTLRGGCSSGLFKGRCDHGRTRVGPWTLIAATASRQLSGRLPLSLQLMPLPSPPPQRQFGLPLHRRKIWIPRRGAIRRTEGTKVRSRRSISSCVLASQILVALGCTALAFGDPSRPSSPTNIFAPASNDASNSTVTSNHLPITGNSDLLQLFPYLVMRILRTCTGNCGSLPLLMEAIPRFTDR
jgi:hypothetical protein